jgi:hypothetical protein
MSVQSDQTISELSDSDIVTSELNSKIQEDKEKDSAIIIIECPHCSDQIEILAINCAIFRHGSFKSTGEQLNPHAPKELCDQVISDGLVNGCAKPFKLIKESGIYKAIICDYI